MPSVSANFGDFQSIGSGSCVVNWFDFTQQCPCVMGGSLGPQLLQFCLLKQCSLEIHVLWAQFVLRQKGIHIDSKLCSAFSIFNSINSHCLTGCSPHARHCARSQNQESDKGFSLSSRSHYAETSVSTSVEWKYWVKANLPHSFLTLKFYGFMKRTLENVRLGFRFDFLKYDNFIIYY